MNIHRFITFVFLCVLFLSHNVYADSIVFTPVGGVDMTDGVGTALSEGDLVKISADDEVRIQSNEPWPNMGEYDESRYIEFIFDISLPEGAVVSDANLKLDFRRTGALSGAKALVWDGNIFHSYDLNTGIINVDELNTVGILPILDSVPKLENTKVRFLAYRQEGANTKTSHDFVGIEVAYSVPPAPDPTPEEDDTPEEVLPEEEVVDDDESDENEAPADMGDISEDEDVVEDENPEMAPEQDTENQPEVVVRHGRRPVVAMGSPSVVTPIIADTAPEVQVVPEVFTMPVAYIETVVPVEKVEVVIDSIEVAPEVIEESEEVVVDSIALSASAISGMQGFNRSALGQSALGLIRDAFMFFTNLFK